MRSITDHMLRTTDFGNNAKSHRQGNEMAHDVFDASMFYKGYYYEAQAHWHNEVFHYYVIAR